jgi:hypothetical protein
MAMLASAPARAQGHPGTVAGEVSVRKKGLFGTSNSADRSGVVVWIEGVPGAPPPRAPQPAPTIRQRDKQFVPRVIAIRKGTSVEFPNDDKIFHNVFSLSQAGKFDLGLYKSGSSKTVLFDKAGVIDVYCNIHPDMVSSIRVVDSPHFLVTDKAGRFLFEGVLPGTWPIVAWAPGGDEVRGTVTVTPGKVAQAHLDLEVGGGADHHLRKDGTPYGRYQ